MSKLKVSPREVVGKKVKTLRAEEKVPAVLFGPSVEPTNVVIDAKEFGKVFEEAGYSNLINIEAEGGKKERVLIKEVQIHPLKDYVIHASLYVIDKNKPITAEVPIQFLGEAPAEEQGLGFVVTPVESVMIACLPDNLPSHFEVSLDSLLQVGDTISIEDIKLPEGVEFESNVEVSTAIAMVATPQKVEDLLAEMEEGAEGEEGEEGAEGEEGEGEEGAAEGSADSDAGDE